MSENELGKKMIERFAEHLDGAIEEIEQIEDPEEQERQRENLRAELGKFRDRLREIQAHALEKQVERE